MGKKTSEKLPKKSFKMKINPHKMLVETKEPCEGVKSIAEYLKIVHGKITENTEIQREIHNKKERNMKIKFVNFRTVKRVFILFTVCAILINMIIACGIGKEIPMSSLFTKTYSNYIDGDLLGWCYTKDPIIPILYQDKKVIFCNDVTLQNVGSEINVPGKITSYKLKNIKDRGLTDKTQIAIMTFVYEHENSYTMVSYKITNNTTKTGEYTVTTNKIFENNVDNMQILGYHYDHKPYHNNTVCLSDDMKTLYLFDDKGELLSNFALNKPTIFLEDVNYKYIFYGTDGDKIYNYSIIDNSIIEVDQTKLGEITYDIADLSLNMIPGIRYDSYPYMRNEILIYNSENIFIIDREPLKVSGVKKAPGLLENLDHRIFNSKKGLHIIGTRGLYGNDNTLKYFGKVLNGNFKLHLSAHDNPYNYIWFASEIKNNFSCVVKIYYGVSTSRISVAKYKIGTDLKVKCILPKFDANEIVIITDKGVYQKDNNLEYNENVYEKNIKLR